MINNGKNLVMQFVEGLAQTLQINPKLIILIAKKYPDVLKSAIQTYQETLDMTKAAETFSQAAQTLQQLTQTMKHGAKLQYIKSLKHQCADDEELVYYRKGGSVDCGCAKKGGEIEKSEKGPVAKFKEIRKGKTGFDITAYADATGSQGGFKKAKKKKLEYNKPGNNKPVTNVATQDKNPGSTKQPMQEAEERARHKNNYNNLKKGGEVKKECGGSKVIANFKAKCGTKMKKHKLGGSLNGIPFMQAGTHKGGVKWKTSPRPDYIYNGKPVYPPTKYSPERGNAEKHYLIDPHSGTLLDSSESNFMNDLEDTRHPMGGYDASYELAKDWDTNSEKYRKNPILVSGFVSDLIGNRGFGRQIGSSWGNAYPHNPGWIKNPLFKKGYYYRY